MQRQIQSVAGGKSIQRILVAVDFGVHVLAGLLRSGKCFDKMSLRDMYALKGVPT
jgi:hypothetical protein